MNLSKEEKAKVKKAEREKLAAEAITLHIAGLSTREIAKRLGTSPATISRILTGKTKLPDTTVATYANNTTPTPNSPSEGRVEGNSPSMHNPQQAIGAVGGIEISLPPAISTDPQSIIDHAQSAVIDIIKRIQDVADGEEDIAKLATAADKLTGVAERIANITRLANQQQAEQDGQSTANTFIRDFAARHKA